jgi:hypothetical protein
MNLDEAQRKQVAAWVEQGLKLSEIQTRLAAELGLRLTYMDVRLLVDDLKLTPKDLETPRPLAPTLAAAGPPLARGPAAEPRGRKPKPPGVSVSVDELARPGAFVSGKVTFSDGNTADWYLDQAGRLGLAPEKNGYRPPAADFQEFQAALDAELTRLGF